MITYNYDMQEESTTLFKLIYHFDDVCVYVQTLVGSVTWKLTLLSRVSSVSHTTNFNSRIQFDFYVWNSHEYYIMFYDPYTHTFNGFHLALHQTINHFNDKQNDISIGKPFVSNITPCISTFKHVLNMQFFKK